MKKMFFVTLIVVSFLMLSCKKHTPPPVEKVTLLELSESKIFLGEADVKVVEIKSGNPPYSLKQVDARYEVDDLTSPSENCRVRARIEGNRIILRRIQIKKGEYLRGNYNIVDNRQRMVNLKVDDPGRPTDLCDFE